MPSTASATCTHHRASYTEPLRPLLRRSKGSARSTIPTGSSRRSPDPGARATLAHARISSTSTEPLRSRTRRANPRATPKTDRLPAREHSPSSLHQRVRRHRPQDTGRRPWSAASVPRLGPTSVASSSSRPPERRSGKRTRLDRRGLPRVRDTRGFGAQSIRGLLVHAEVAMMLPQWLHTGIRTERLRSRSI